MAKYTEQQLQQNYADFIEFLKKAFSGDRLDKLLHMYSEKELGINALISPASGNIDYHNSYDGGYLDHIMNVAKNGMKMMKMYQDSGGIINFTQEELLFSAIHHDLGKLGDVGKIHFLPNESEWHIKNQGKLYVPNPALSYITVTDRTFLLLNRYGIKYSETEFFGIKLADGMYEDENARYLRAYNATQHRRTNIPYIIHWADHMSTCIERDTVRPK